MEDKKKINLLFDATILAENFKITSSSRSGIFFTALNVLKELIKHEEFNVELYASNYNYIGLKIFLKETPFGCLKMVENRNFFINILSELKFLRYENRKTTAKKTQTLFMILKRMAIKICIFFMEIPLNIFKVNKHFPFSILDSFDIYFSPAHKPPETILNSKKIKKYTIIHDVIPIVQGIKETHPDSFKKSWFIELLNSIKKEDFYFANSEYTKQDFIKYVPQIDGDKITTTLLAAGENFYRDTDKETFVKIKEKYNLPQDKRYILSLCTLEPRKNLIFTIKNFIKFIEKNNIDDLVFVLGGAYWPSFIGELKKEIKNLGEYKEKIIRTGYIYDDDLASLYSNAEMFVYTSLYEGFGLPPLEAMQCGCPVITSNVTSIPEVVGDAGIMINPKSDKELIQAYEKLYYDEDLRHEFSKKGLERAKEFSWKKCVNIMVEKMIKDFKESSL